MRQPRSKRLGGNSSSLNCAGKQAADQGSLPRGLRHSCSCLLGQLQLLKTPWTILAGNDESRRLEGITFGAEAMAVGRLAGLPWKAAATLGDPEGAPYREGRSPRPAEGGSVKCKLRAPRNTFHSAKRETEAFEGLLVRLHLPLLALVLLANPSPTPTPPHFS